MKVIDTETIIVNLLKEDKKSYLLVDRLLHLCNYIYEQLSEKNLIEKYKICFEINFEAIERTVFYNNNIFKLDIDGEVIYLRDANVVNTLTQKYETDSEIVDIIKKFSEDYAA